MKPTIHIQIEYPVFFSCSVGGHTGVLATVSSVSSSHSECTPIWTDPKHKDSIVSSLSSLQHHLSLDWCKIPNFLLFLWQALPEPCAPRIVEDLPILQPLDGWSRGSLGSTDQLDAFI